MTTFVTCLAFWSLVELCWCELGDQNPNILVILSDDLGWNDIGYHNAAGYETPNIDKFGQTGLILDNFYVQQICSPTRGAFLSGRYPIHIGLNKGVVGSTTKEGLPLDIEILPQQLRKYSNYFTHIVGKWHLGFYKWEYTPLFRGFDTHFGYYTGNTDYYRYNLWVSNETNGYDLRDGFKPIHVDKSIYSTKLYASKTIRIIKNHLSKDIKYQKKHPFFIYLAWNAIHGPLKAPRKWTNSNLHIKDPKRSIAAATTQAMDFYFGEIINVIKSNEYLWNNTLIIWMSDNGAVPAFGSNNWPLRGRKKTLFEGGIRVPALINGGILLDNLRGKISNNLTHIVDLLPSIANLVGFTPFEKDKLDGYDLSPFLFKLRNNRNVRQEWPRDEILHNINPGGCQIKNDKVPICGAIRWKNYKLIIGTTSEITRFVKKQWNLPINTMYTNETYKISQLRPSLNCNYQYNNISNFEELLVLSNNLENNASYRKNVCPYNGNGCLYDIIMDPCEFNDIHFKNSSTKKIYKFLISKLTNYSKTMMKKVYIKGNKEANPKYHNGFWSPWFGHDTFYNETKTPWPKYTINLTYNQILENKLTLLLKERKNEMDYNYHETTSMNHNHNNNNSNNDNNSIVVKKFVNNSVSSTSSTSSASSTSSVSVVSQVSLTALQQENYLNLIFVVCASILCLAIVVCMITGKVRHNKKTH